MSVLKILQYPDPRLRKKAYQVTEPQASLIQKIIDDMLETLAQTQNCAGLSATQLDIDTPPNITVINSMAEDNTVYCLINPKIVASSGEKIGDEGCMSVSPGDLYAKVKRAAKVTVEALDRNNKPIVLEAEGFLARCLQHEVDHLNGILYIDHLSRLKRVIIEKKLAKTRK